jgi:ribosomal protein S18 acetylase RimI-like enzyme
VIRAFTDDDVPAAAALLVERHRQHRADSPLLDPLDQAAAEVAVAALTDGLGGAVAVEGDRVAGYLLARTRTGDWGPNAWVEAAGCAGDQLPELYAHCAADWVAAGLTAHYALVPPFLTDAFVRLTFGLMHLHGAQPTPAGWEDPRVRRGTPDDIPVLADLDLAFQEHFPRSPIFSALTQETREALVEDWTSTWDDGFEVWVAEVDGAVGGYLVGCDVSKSSANAGLVAPATSGHLASAAVFPAYRGQGLARALAGAFASWAEGTGYATVCTDWRSANLEADRTWRGLGFVPTFHRMHRHIGY